MSGPKVCQWCGEELLWTEHGWRHRDGSVYKQRCMTREEELAFEERHGRKPVCRECLVDDHCVLPVDAPRPGTFVKA